MVEKILKTGAGFAGRHGVAGALWTRGETFFAEARVFAVHSSPEDTVETMYVQAREGDAAITLLEAKIKEKFGDVKWLHWQDAAENSGTPGS